MSSITWRSPSNIALIKYWGKRGIQLPMNPSLSFSLSEAYTETTLTVTPRKSNRTEISFEFFIEGNKNEIFELKVGRFLRMINALIPGLQGNHLEIQSKNSFPHSSGIASSASAFSALSLCLCTAEEEVYGRTSGFTNFKEKASYMARMGSGSAARSIYGGFVSWGDTTMFENSTDEWAMPLPVAIAPEFEKLNNSILIVSTKSKKVSSSMGHEYMETNPYAGIRYRQAIKNYRELVDALQKGNERNFLRIVEDEALSLHAMFLTSQPGYFLALPETIEIIEKIKQFRNDTGLFICFTLDAGPNVHLLYGNKGKDKILEFINNDLLSLCEDRKCIHDFIGNGPEQIM